MTLHIHEHYYTTINWYDANHYPAKTNICSVLRFITQNWSILFSSAKLFLLYESSFLYPLEIFSSFIFWLIQGKSIFWLVWQIFFNSAEYNLMTWWIEKTLLHLSSYSRCCDDDTRMCVCHVCRLLVTLLLLFLLSRFVVVFWLPLNLCHCDLALMWCSFDMLWSQP